MVQTFDDILDSFSYLDNWEDRYKYILELGSNLQPYPESQRDNAHKIPGCVAQLWLTATSTIPEKDPILTFIGDSDAHIVKGLIYIILSLYSGKHASEILTIPAESFLKQLKLDEHLTRQRSQGIRSMILHIRTMAQNSLI